MNTSSSSAWERKHTWSQIDRHEPPKRSAAERVADFGEIDGTFGELEASEQASRCIQCANPGCVHACPLENPIPDLLSLTADGKFKEAASLLCASHSLPELFAHICINGHLCERACVLAARFEAVPISAIARFLLHYAWDHGVSEPALAPANGQRIAVLGSGIGGLVGADALSRLGYAITVMDSRAKPGGRMVNGLPGFRVDTTLIERRIELLKQRGVQFRMGLAYGKDVKLSELQRQFDAVFLALARVEPVPLQIPGAQLADVELAAMFLAQVAGKNGREKKPVELRGRRVAVLGGGDTAMNALRTAIRLGAAQALCVYRRDEANMPATLDQFQNAVEEGAQFEFLAQPVSLVGNAAGKVAGVRCVRMQLKKTGAPGRPEVQPVMDSEFELPADVVLVAYGYKPARLPQMEAFAELGMDELGCIPVDSNHMTNLDRVFAGGSIVRGPVPISEVVRDARSAVASIDHYLLAKRQQPAGVEVPAAS